MHNFYPNILIFSKLFQACFRSDLSLYIFIVHKHDGFKTRFIRFLGGLVKKIRLVELLASSPAKDSDLVSLGCDLEICIFKHTSKWFQHTLRFGSTFTEHRILCLQCLKQSCWKGEDPSSRLFLLQITWLDSKCSDVGKLLMKTCCRYIRWYS